jgi:hypothetical protein
LLPWSASRSCFYALDGFTIDGQEKLAGVPSRPTWPPSFKDRQSVRSQVSDGHSIYVSAADGAAVQGTTSRDITAPC